MLAWELPNCDLYIEGIGFKKASIERLIQKALLTRGIKRSHDNLLATWVDILHQCLGDRMIAHIGGDSGEIDGRVKRWYRFTDTFVEFCEVQTGELGAARQKRVGHRDEINAWIKDCAFSNQREAAKHLGVGFDVLKSIMRGGDRHGSETEAEVLKRVRRPRVN